MQGQVLIIGAGPVGLAMAKALREADTSYVQVEATDHVGGNWAHGVYATAHIISSRRTTQYPDWPMPKDYPAFPSAAQMCAYYEAFTDAHGLRESIRFETEVTRCAPVDGGASWTVAFADGSTEAFDTVVVCNGHHWKRVWPRWIEDFDGEALHSKDYKHPDQLRDKAVLVIGGGNSGCDLASEAARVSASCDWSLRRGYWFLPKLVGGIPTIELARADWPESLQKKALKRIIRFTLGDYTRYGLPAPDHDLYETHPTISSEIFHYLRHGRVQVRRDVASVSGRTVTFTDGETGTFDLIACATGFDVAFPMLPDGMVPVQGKTPALYGSVCRPEVRGLFVVGAYQPRYGLGPIVRPLAVEVAHWIALERDTGVATGEVLRSMGVTPPTTHLVGPFDAMRKLRWARRLRPVLRWQAKRLASA